MLSDFTTELRHKYLTILKSLYWEYFEEGQCGAEAVSILMESADRALDHEDGPMLDWDYIRTYAFSHKWTKFLSKLAQIPLIGKVISNSLFDIFMVQYDVCVNFIEAHNEASLMLKNVIQENDVVKVIQDEANN
jgi:hypothetical protein